MPALTEKQTDMILRSLMTAHNLSREDAAKKMDEMKREEEAKAAKKAKAAAPAVLSDKAIRALLSGKPIKKRTPKQAVRKTWSEYSLADGDILGFPVGGKSEAPFAAYFRMLFDTRTDEFVATYIGAQYRLGSSTEYKFAAETRNMLVYPANTKGNDGYEKAIRAETAQALTTITLRKFQEFMKSCKDSDVPQYLLGAKQGQTFPLFKSLCSGSVMEAYISLIPSGFDFAKKDKPDFTKRDLTLSALKRTAEAETETAVAHSNAVAIVAVGAGAGAATDDEDDIESIDEEIEEDIVPEENEAVF